MTTQPEWQWNEIQQVGTDFANAAEVEVYDKRMGEFRDIAAENAGILAALALSKNSRVLEIGCGTGRFARAAGQAGHTVTAIDISPAMLAYAASQAKAEGLDKVAFKRAGFLTMDFAPESFDAAVSGAALHHLPDAWKYVAMRNIFKALKPGGIFVLRDVVFSFEGDNYSECFDAFVNSCPEGMRMHAARHIAREYSTMDWVIEGLLKRAGFVPAGKVVSSPSFVEYRSVRPVNAQTCAEATIVKAEERDAAELLAVQKAAFAQEAEIYSTCCVQPLHETEDEVRGSIGKMLVLKAKAEGRIVGAVRGQMDAEGVCHIGRLCVLPQHQNMGLGRRLMKTIEASFAQATRYQIFTGSRSAKNLALYESLGYRRTGETKTCGSVNLVYLEK